MSGAISTCASRSPDGRRPPRRRHRPPSGPSTGSPAARPAGPCGACCCRSEPPRSRDQNPRHVVKLGDRSKSVRLPPLTTTNTVTTSATTIGMTSAMANPEFIYVDGAMAPYANATIHVASVAAKCGANVFEGLCAYAGDGGRSFVFRLKEHLVRLHNTVRMMQIDCDYGEADYTEAVLTSLRENRIRGDAHIRLTVFITGEGTPDTRGPASLVCISSTRAATPLDSKGTHAAISSWRRIDDAVTPPRIKAGANYHNSRFGLLEARRNGYDEAIFLPLAGKIGEGGAACFAMVRGGVLIPPPVTASILESVTRATLLQLAAEELGLPVQEREID